MNHPPLLIEGLPVQGQVSDAQASCSCPLRVLVVLPFYGGSLPVGHYCAKALKSLGHTVEVFEAPAFYSAFSALKGLRVTSERLESLENGFLQVVSQAIYAKVETFEPDLVLCLAQAPLNRQVLKRLQRDHVATAMWFVEDFQLFTYWRAFAPCYDFFFVIQKEPFLQALHTAGVSQAIYLPMAALPELHRPLDLTAQEQRQYGSDVSFLGAGYPNRRVAFRQLMSFDFKIWGSDWEGESVLTRYLQAAGQRISSEDSIKIFNASKVNLNLHSSIQTKQLISQGDFVNPRTFEVAACEAFQLVDKRSLLPELFADDELATFASMDELLEKMAWYLANPESRYELAQKGRARVLAQHTYAHRMQKVLDTVHAARPQWPKPRTGLLPEELPENLRNELQTLLNRLELPAHVPFEEVITRLRQQSGTLSPLETSLLFLDEWRKQYSTRASSL